MASSLMSTAATAAVATAASAQANMVAPFNGLKSTSAFPVTKKSNDITSIASNGGRVQCMQGWVPCLEFELEEGFVHRKYHASPGYYDGRYWTMWKLPMFGCTDPAQVVNELEEAKKAYPQSFIRIIGFDNVRQVQCISFIAYKPAGY